MNGKNQLVERAKTGAPVQAPAPLPSIAQKGEQYRKALPDEAPKKQEDEKAARPSEPPKRVSEIPRRMGEEHIRGHEAIAEGSWESTLLPRSISFLPWDR